MMESKARALSDATPSRASAMERGVANEMACDDDEQRRVESGKQQHAASERTIQFRKSSVLKQLEKSRI